MFIDFCDFLKLSLSFLLLQNLIKAKTFHCDPMVSCGCSLNPVTMNRIIGGEDAVVSSWGWAVSILTNESSLCGGSIISQSWILTAAHCVEHYQRIRVLVSASANTLLANEQRRLSRSIHLHPNYAANQFINDIALIEVYPPFNMSHPSIAKVCLPTADINTYPAINSSVMRMRVCSIQYAWIRISF